MVMDAPTMGRLARISYTHQDMIDYILTNPGCGLKELALRYGYTIGWISNIMASDAWKAAFAKRREEMVDGGVARTIQERFEGVTALALDRLQEKLEAPQVPDRVVLRAVELGAKAIGVGGNAAPPPASVDHLAQLAARLIHLQSQVRKGVTLDGQAEVVSGS